MKNDMFRNYIICRNSCKGKSRFEIYAPCLVFLLPGSVKTFVCNFHQGVEGDPRFTLVDDLSLSLLVDLERLREL